MNYDLSNNYKLEVAKQRFQELADKKAMIELKELQVPHSISSHRLYFVWLNCIAIETGRDKDELHHLYRMTFLQRPEEEILEYLKPEFWQTIQRFIIDFKYFSGAELVVNTISESTAFSANKNPIDDEKFSRYMNNIRKHARVNFGVILLTKDDQNFKEFYREYGFK
jgi:hypothetical protein